MAPNKALHRWLLIAQQRKLQPPRGMRDYEPGLWRVITSLRDKWMDLARKWGYDPIETPVLEHLWVLETKAGQQVRKEIYWFEDKAGRELGLRFDMTVPIARYVAMNPQLPKPIRLCYFSRVWRYDEPQAGRWREFWQYGIELIGSKHVEADAEVIALFTESYRRVGLDVEVRLFDRRIMESLLEKYGIPDWKKHGILTLIDKRWKIGEDEFKEQLYEQNLSQEQVEALVEFTATRKPLKESISLIADVEPKLREFYEELVSLLEAYGVLDRILFDASIVRGLEYYTGLVFEAYYTGGDEKWKRLALGGGGRYDKLLGLYRKPGAPATGFAIGVDRVIMLLKELGLVEEKPEPIDVMVVSARELYREAIKIALKLREKGLRVEVDVMRRRIKEALRYANKRNVKILVYVAPREYKERKVVVRNLVDRIQEYVDIDNITEYVERELKVWRIS